MPDSVLKIETCYIGNEIYKSFVGWRLTVGKETLLIWRDQLAMSGFRLGDGFIPNLGQQVEYFEIRPMDFESRGVAVKAEEDHQAEVTALRKKYESEIMEMNARHIQERDRLRRDIQTLRLMNDQLCAAIIDVQQRIMNDNLSGTYGNRADYRNALLDHMPDIRKLKPVQPNIIFPEADLPKS